MRPLLLILFVGLVLAACITKDDQPNFQAEYSYNVEGWESLGTQTLVMLDARNNTHLNKEITLKVDVINTDGQVFTKDTTIEFEKGESSKSSQLIVDTQGEIKDVRVYSN